MTRISDRFLDALSHLYKRVCPSARQMVGWSVGPSVRHTRVEFLRNGPNLNKIAPEISMPLKRHSKTSSSPERICCPNSVLLVSVFFSILDHSDMVIFGERRFRFLLRRCRKFGVRCMKTVADSRPGWATTWILRSAWIRESDILHFQSSCPISANPTSSLWARIEKNTDKIPI